MNSAAIEEMDFVIRRLREVLCDCMYIHSLFISSHHLIQWQQQREAIHTVEPPNVFYIEDTTSSESVELGQENGPETDINDSHFPLSARLADDSRIASLRALLSLHEEEMKSNNEERRCLLKNLEDQRLSVETASAAVGMNESSTEHLLQEIEVCLLYTSIEYSVYVYLMCSCFY
jgi:hypothetical protein